MWPAASGNAGTPLRVSFNPSIVVVITLALAHARAYSLQNPLSRTTTRSHSARTPPQVANLGGNELLDAVSGFDEAIRSYMIGVLSITFQKVEVRRTA